MPVLIQSEIVSTGAKMFFTRYYFSVSLSLVCLYQHATIKTLFTFSASQRASPEFREDFVSETVFNLCWRMTRRSLGLEFHRVEFLSSQNIVRKIEKHEDALESWPRSATLIKPCDNSQLDLSFVYNFKLDTRLIFIKSMSSFSPMTHADEADDKRMRELLDSTKAQAILRRGSKPKTRERETTTSINFLSNSLVHVTVASLVLERSSPRFLFQLVQR